MRRVDEHVRLAVRARAASRASGDLTEITAPPPLPAKPLARSTDVTLLVQRRGAHKGDAAMTRLDATLTGVLLLAGAATWAIAGCSGDDAPADGAGGSDGGGADATTAPGDGGVADDAGGGGDGGADADDAGGGDGGADAADAAHDGAGSVICGSTYCSSATQDCCYTAPAACITQGATCNYGAGMRTRCDGPEDCAPGDLCMDLPGVYPLTAGCRTVADPYSAYCHSDADCAGSSVPAKCCAVAVMFAGMKKCLMASVCP